MKLSQDRSATARDGVAEFFSRKISVTASTWYFSAVCGKILSNLRPNPTRHLIFKTLQLKSCGGEGDAAKDFRPNNILENLVLFTNINKAMIIEALINGSTELFTAKS